MAELKEPTELNVGLISSETVGAELQYTRNLGNFENVRVSLSLNVSVRDDETYEEAIDRVYAIVEERVQEKVHEIDQEAGKVVVQRGK